MATYLVTGTSRGIGLEIVRQLASSSAEQVKLVIAITRDTKSTALNDLIKDSKGRIVNIVIQDITDEETIMKSIPDIEKALSGKTLDVLINNAGMADWNTDGIKSAKAAQLKDIFNVNVGSVQAMTTSLLPLLEKSQTKKVINISTTLGSIALSSSYGFAPSHGYKTSKAALNMLTKLYALEYKDKGFTFLLVSPGWLKTDLGSQQADLPVEVGVKAVLDIIFTSTASDNGRYRNVLVKGWENVEGPNKYDGADVPW